MEVNKVYNEDCLMTMGLMHNECVDLTVTSPPYDGLRKYNGYSFEFEKVAWELLRITKKGGVVVWVVGDQTKDGSESGTSFRQALFFKQIGFKLYDTMLYRKINFIPKTHRRCEQEFEYIFVLSKGNPKTFNPIMVDCKTAGDKFNFARKGYGFKEGSVRRRDENFTTNQQKIHGNIFSYPVGSSGKNHPAIFPLKLAHDQISIWSNETDLVYDPFIGSGTTRDAAIELKRNYIGSEISTEYYNLL